MNLTVLAGLGATLGALSRFEIMNLFKPLNARMAIPYSTLLINLGGSFILGWLTGISPTIEWQTFLGAGFCGGLTTFSTWMNESIILMKDGQRRDGMIYDGLSLLLGVILAGLGYLLGIH
ncbi:fluoride efflux transporter FluC [Levilactobacillus bambusae]|uniref:Fluoride-specific ion channel FluC n=1 Tax=Levilactobacillus bambusae TaxID=2024736 RepID=A0A2V1MZ89_9LACO|nr:CrcB family protein [Levilactobacillus bambusae]PWF99474.1 chromosome condensation protein CrcB [Levilactobacillus bambusae]